jgi:hypothetical protein
MPLPVMWSDEVLFLLSSFRKTRDKLRSWCLWLKE